jgi:hypothetical protein
MSTISATGNLLRPVTHLIMSDSYTELLITESELRNQTCYEWQGPGVKVSTFK